MATAPKTSAATLATRNEVRGVIPRVIELTEIAPLRRHLGAPRPVQA